LFSETDINERIYWLMQNLNMDYDTIINSPWENLDWLYRRHLQYLIDQEKQRNAKSNKFI
jgi:hypothetical protein